VVASGVTAATAGAFVGSVLPPEAATLESVAEGSLHATTTCRPSEPNTAKRMGL
jgi:hypothetical protein